MKTLLLLTLVILAICSDKQIQNSINLQSQEVKKSVEDIPRLPVYAGVGYDILQGNPMDTKELDPGFKRQIFDLKYTKGEQTEDGKYLIPDYMDHRKVTSCSFNTQVSTFRGTTSYQSTLSQKAKIDGGYKGLLFKASFSASDTYKKIQNSTKKSYHTLTHAMADCQNYKLTMDLFSTDIALSQGFKNGVQISHKQNSWDVFIHEFGSHFVNQVIMGGIVIQQNQYQRIRESQLQSVGVDINVAAKASFAKFYGDASFDWNKHSKQISYSDQMKSSTNQIYIGGKPPTNGSIMDWQKSVINDPMPVSYRMLPLSDLFTWTSQDKAVNLTLAKTQFLQALDVYCTKRGCVSPDPDNTNHQQQQPKKIIQQQSVLQQEVHSPVDSIPQQ